jgi:uncharacterized protein YdhG (YjbR/CyaY superfamily)
MKKETRIKTIAQFIENYPEELQILLLQMYKTIKEAAPEAEECISYGMPAFKLNGPLVYFAAYKHHIGFYPTPSGIAPFKSELAKYKTSKGAIQFPINEPLPLGLVAKITKHRVKLKLESK